MTIAELSSLKVGSKVKGPSGIIMNVTDTMSFEDKAGSYSRIAFKTTTGQATVLYTNDPRLTGMVEKLQEVL